MKLNEFNYGKASTGRLYRKNDIHRWIQVDNDSNIFGFSTNISLKDLYSDDWVELRLITIGDIVLDNDDIIGILIDQIDDNTYYMFDENGCVRKVAGCLLKKLECGGDILSRMTRDIDHISEKYNSN